MTIGKKLVISFCALAILLMIVSVVSVSSFLALSRHVSTLAIDSLPGVYITAQIDALGKSERITMLSHLAAGGQNERESYEKQLSALDARFISSLRSYEKTTSTQEDREIFSRILPVHNRLMEVWTKVETLSRAAQTQQAFALWNAEMIPAANAQASAVGALSDFNKKSGDEASASALSTAQWTQRVLITVTVISLLMAVLLSFYNVKSINGALTKLVREISESTGQVTAASAQIASSSQSLAQGASEQAASIEETSASTEEIASMANRNREHASNASLIVKAEETKFREANVALEHMVSAMRDIETSSAEIAKIISVIDNIAFQTNILALNAAVEAARAGDAGLGFAVVADEVRTLARRCAVAAQDTSALIERSRENSRLGTTNVGRLEQAIKSVSADAEKVTVLVDEMQVASVEQTRGLEQIGKALVQMEQVTQNVASSSEEGAAAAEELSSQAKALQYSVGNLAALIGISV